MHFRKLLGFNKPFTSQLPDYSLTALKIQLSARVARDDFTQDVRLRSRTEYVSPDVVIDALNDNDDDAAAADGDNQWHYSPDWRKPRQYGFIA
jgi:hypothetical protein